MESYRANVRAYRRVGAQLDGLGLPGEAGKARRRARYAGKQLKHAQGSALRAARVV